MTRESNPVARRSIVLTGMMGAGKTAVGRRLAASMGLPFLDSDAEIEAACGMSIPEFFRTRGEAAFRETERKTIFRLLDGPRCVLSTGGGAFMDPATRARIAESGISVWLKAGTDILFARTSRREDRPILHGGDPREKLAHLLAEREPVYAMADVVVESDDRPVHVTAERVLGAIAAFSEKTSSGKSKP